MKEAQEDIFKTFKLARLVLTRVQASKKKIRTLIKHPSHFACLGHLHACVSLLFSYNRLAWEQVIMKSYLHGRIICFSHTHCTTRKNIFEP